MLYHEFENDTFEITELRYKIQNNFTAELEHGCY